ncbi:MAG TPA: TonB-dependent receptor [Candidatus Prevotella avicola]|uniref:TonB-dependent receptor n=1 Tax=Candidatus Prevotella avicola TaxID=2838738 RepID=A0A9D2FZ00_9BACT|nr:TonB-dependent receptor [Candidatus Prevotella avicola]
MEKRLMMFIAGLFLSMGVALAQTQVNGTVTSADDGEPVIGASIRVEGTKTGTVTDINGNFQLSAPAGSTLVISYLGMESQKVKAGSNLRVSLQTDSHSLEEVIVTGYGVTRKAAFTGAANTLSEDMISNKIDPNPIKALEGTIPGLQMNIGSGQPGAPATIFLRGRNSLNSGTQPLYVIDGMPFDNSVVGMRASEGTETSPLSTINAQDIESITVLKDATATSIYGARAANGVIVITTKRGSVGKPKVNFTAKLGFNEMPSYTDKYKLVNADQNIEMATEAMLNSYNENGLNSTFGLYNTVYGLGLDYTKQGAEEFYDFFTGGWLSNYRATGKQTNWLDEVTQTGLIQSYSVDVSGGGNNANSPVYYASFAYDSNESMMKGKDLSRYSFRFNMDHQASKWIKYGFNTNLSYTKINNGAGGGYYSDPLTQAFMMNPMTSVYDDEGNWNFDTTTGYNPVAMRSKNGDVNNMKQYRVLWSPYLQINFTPDLFFISRFGLDAYFLDEFGFWSFLQPQGAEMNGMGENTNSSSFMMTITNTLNYVKTFNDKHHLNLMLGQEGQKTRYKQAYLAGSNYPVDDKPDVGLAAVPGSAATARTELILNSYFFNGQYDYANKYYLSASLRADGSSRFADGNRWSTFWSVGAKYRLSEEKFMESTKSWLSDLAIRASYGTTGNQEVGSGYYAASDLYSYIGYLYNGMAGMVYTQMGNKDLQWETTKKFNVGLDFTLFNRVNVSLDYYNHQTTDMVFAMPLSFATGLSSIYRNIGKLENKGFEFTINAQIIKNKNWDWSVNVTGSTNSNKVKKLSTDNPIEGTIQITEVGRPIYQFKMKEYAGVNPENGHAMWYQYANDDPSTPDVDERTIKTENYNAAEKRYLGDANPDFFGSFGTTLRAYGFDLNVQFNYSVGAKIFSNNLVYDAQIGGSFYENYIQYVYDNRWQKPGDITDVPRLTTDPTYENSASSRFLMDGDYLKIRSLTFGYTLPKSWLRNTFINNLRVFMEAENLYTFTADNYIGMDPAGVTPDGLAAWNYPQPRSFVFGVQLGF